MFYSEYREGKAPLSILSQKLVYYILELMVGLLRVHPLQNHSPRSPLLGKSSSSPFQLMSMASFKFLQLDRVSKGLLNLSHTAVQCFGFVSTTPPLSFLNSAEVRRPSALVLLGRRAIAVLCILVAQVFQSGWGSGTPPAGSLHQALLQHRVEALAAFQAQAHRISPTLSLTAFPTAQ